MEHKEKSREVIYKFYLPDNLDEFNTFQSAEKMGRILQEISDECRNMWKYNEEASEETIEFAHKIAGMCYLVKED